MPTSSNSRAAALVLAVLAAPSVAQPLTSKAKSCPVPYLDTITEVVRPLAWQGRATVFAGDKQIAIRVRTRIAADGSVVSESWPVEQGDKALRRMIIDSTGGWLERGGKREPMPTEMLEHERQQFGFYTQLQKVMARRKGLPVFSAPKVEVEGLVPTTFVLDHSLNPVEAHNVVSSAEPGGKPISQRFELRGEIVSNCLSWPREIRIVQESKPYFALTIETFEAGARP
jgi:hypothetical protein